MHHQLEQNGVNKKMVDCHGYSHEIPMEIIILNG